MKTIKFTTNRRGNQIAILDGVEYRKVSILSNDAIEYFNYKGQLYERRNRKVSRIN